MVAVLLASWLVAAPVFPLNPVKQDTLNFMNLHLTAGLTGPNTLTGSGVEVSAKYETMIHHPFVVRTAFDYRYGAMSSALFPKGVLHGTTYSVDALYYRGTNRMTGYLGMGLVLVKYYLGISEAAADSLRRTSGVVDVGMRPKIGYRLTLGLRFKRDFSLEVGITEVRPTIINTRRLGAHAFSMSYQEVRLHDVRVTLGYVLPVRL